MLQLYSDYDRKSVHDIFDPGAAFTRGAGLWGLQGAIEVPSEPNSFVFFVSYGQHQGDHEFDEGIDATGILRWQSQPAQGLDMRSQLGTLLLPKT